MPFPSLTRRSALTLLGATAALPLLAQPALAAPQAFRDVPSDAQFSREIQWLAEEGIASGTKSGLFRPRSAVSRGQMAAFLYRAQGSPEFSAPKSAPFTDVKPSSQFAKEIAWLAESGISTGLRDGSFRPRSSVTRGQMAVFLHRVHAQPAASADLSNQVEALVHRKINAERSAKGLGALTRDARIDTVATDWSATMTMEDFLHNPDYSEQIPSGWSAAAENIVAGSYGDDATAEEIAEDFVTRWMESEGHRANILGKAYTTTGVGVAKRVDGGMLQYFSTQNFARY